MTTGGLYYQVHGHKPPRRAPRRARHGRGPARSSRYKAWIRSLACAACGKTVGIEAAHTGSDGGARQKASDYSCIPLCLDCHQADVYSWHRNRAACERRIFARLNVTTLELVQQLNGEWKLAPTRVFSFHPRSKKRGPATAHKRSNMSIITQILFSWIFAALSAGTPPAQFDATGHYVGTQTTATAHARLK